MPSSRNPQTDGASNLMTRKVGNNPRCYLSYHQDDWDASLPADKFRCSPAVTEDDDMSSFEFDIGWNPKSEIEFVRRYESSF